MPQPGTAGGRRDSRDGGAPPSRIAAFDPVGEIAVVDRRAAERAAAAERFASAFGLDDLAESAAAIADRWDVRYEPSDAGPAGRRTITITGQGAGRIIAPRERPESGPGARRAGRASRSPMGRAASSEFRGDRAALWAVGLGLLLILAAVASAHAAPLAGLVVR